MSEQRNPRNEAQLSPAVERMRDERASFTSKGFNFTVEDRAAFIDAALEGIPAAVSAIGSLQVKLIDAGAEINRLRALLAGVPELLEGAADDNTAVLQMTAPNKVARDTLSDDLRAKAQAIRAALSESAGAE